MAAGPFFSNDPSIGNWQLYFVFGGTPFANIRTFLLQPFPHPVAAVILKDGEEGVKVSILRFQKNFYQLVHLASVDALEQNHVVLFVCEEPPYRTEAEVAQVVRCDSHSQVVAVPSPDTRSTAVHLVECSLAQKG